MDCGIIAGERAVESCEEGDFSHDFLSEYEKRWYRLHGEKDFTGWYMFKFIFGRPAKEIDYIGRCLGEHDGRFEDDFFDKISKSIKSDLRVMKKLRRQGLDLDEMTGFMGLIKKYFKNYWDFFVE
jgi:flavin-dependent dehydrogenase